MPKPGEMTDHEKAKDAYSIHQDGLFWSRAQTLIAIQGGTLAGGYSLHEHPGLAVPLLVLGAVLTGLLCAAADQDQKDRDQAFRESRVPLLRDPPSGKGRRLMNWVFGLLFVADAWLLIWIALGHGWLAPGFLTPS